MEAIALNGSDLLLAASAAAQSNSKDITIYDVSDPLDTTRFLITYPTPGQSADVAISAGMAFVADGAAGLTVVNYLDLDQAGVAPTATADLSHLDVAPELDGIQVIRGSRVFLAPDVADDVQIKEVRLLFDGALVDSDQSFPFTFRPEVEDEVLVQFAVEDTGGNVGLSEAVTVEVIDDLAAPHLVRSTPADGGAGANVTQAVLMFDEPLDPSSFDSSAITLTDLGPVGVPGGGDDAAVILNSAVLLGTRVVAVDFGDPLPYANYQLNIAAAAIVDRFGNALTEDFTLSFFSIDAAPDSAIWTSASAGSFHDPANWVFGIVPDRVDIVMNPPGGMPPVTIDAKVVAGNFFTAGELVIERDTTYVDGDWIAQANVKFDGGSAFTEGSAEFLANLDITRGTFEFFGPLIVRGDLAIESATLLFNGSLAQLQVDGTLSSVDPGIRVESGGDVEIPWIESYDTAGDFAGLRPVAPGLVATGNGSMLRVPGLSSITGPVNWSVWGVPSIVMEASSGGTLELPMLASIGAGRVTFKATGAGSVLDIPELEQISGPVSAFLSSVDVRNGGVINAPKLTGLDHTTLYLNSSAVFPLEQITSLTDGVLEIHDFSPDLGNLVDLSNSGVIARGGSALGLEVATYSSDRALTIQSRDADTEVTFSNTTSLTGPAHQIGSDRVKIETLGGGLFSAPNVTEIDGAFNITSRQDGSVIDLSVVGVIESGASYPTLIESTDLATLILNPEVVEISNAEIDLDDDGILTVGTMNLANDSVLKGTGTLTGNVMNAGELRLSEVGGIAITGDLAQTAESVCAVSVGLGSDRLGFGTVSVGGALDLGGTLELIVDRRYVPVVDTVLVIATAASVTGDFADVTGVDLGDGLSFAVENDGTTISLRIVQN